MNVNNKKIQSLKKQVLVEVKPSNESLREIEEEVKEFTGVLKKNIKDKKIKADVFVGGSFAKGTFLKKENYDVDIFIRYDKSYNDDELSDLTEKILQNVKFKVKRLHGSRDYFQAVVDENLVIEVVPVRKVSKPEQSVNVTDLSYSHVKYINGKIKSEKIKDEIRITKAFIDSAGVYGAESYISGISGYGVELLIYKYKNLENFLKTILKIKEKEKLIIDLEKQFKDKKIVMMDLSDSKLHSPIILIDPTCKNRNVLAALSSESFGKLKIRAREFFKKPSMNFFKENKIDFDKIRKRVNGNRDLELLMIKSETKKDHGDVAGSKLLKFFKYLDFELSRFFNIKEKHFVYDEENSSEYVFVLRKKEKVIFNGPFVEDKKNIDKFKKEHKKISVKGKRLYAEEKVNFSGKEFINKFKEKYPGRLKEMSISDLKVV